MVSLDVEVVTETKVVHSSVTWVVVGNYTVLLAMVHPIVPPENPTLYSLVSTTTWDGSDRLWADTANRISNIM